MLETRRSGSRSERQAMEPVDVVLETDSRKPAAKREILNFT